MNIDEMEAGPEMDMLVAEKVMGWTQHQSEEFPDMIYWMPDGRDIKGAYKFSPSTSISEAWEVVEKAEKDGFNFFIGFGALAHDI